MSSQKMKTATVKLTAWELALIEEALASVVHVEPISLKALKDKLGSAKIKER